MNDKTGPSPFQLIFPDVSNVGERLRVNRTINFF